MDYSYYTDYKGPSYNREAAHAQAHADYADRQSYLESNTELSKHMRSENPIGVSTGSVLHLEECKHKSVSSCLSNPYCSLRKLGFGQQCVAKAGSATGKRTVIFQGPTFPNVTLPLTDDIESDIARRAKNYTARAATATIKKEVMADNPRMTAREASAHMTRVSTSSFFTQENADAGLVTRSQCIKYGLRIPDTSASYASSYASSPASSPASSRRSSVSEPSSSQGGAYLNYVNTMGRSRPPTSTYTHPANNGSGDFAYGGPDPFGLD